VFETHPDIPAMIVRHFKGERVADGKLTLPAPKFRIA
jgi:hypothetical protein